MSTGQVLIDNLPMWPPDRTATRELNEDLSRTFLEIKHLAIGGGLNINLIVSSLTPINFNAFNWDAAERRADWEETHNRFVEFSDIKDLLSYLHS